MIHSVDFDMICWSYLIGFIGSYFGQMEFE